MRRSAGLFDMVCMRRNRGTKTLLVLATVCIVLITIHIPQFLEMNLLADIDSPIDELDDGVHFGRSQTSETTQRRHNQERILAVNDWDHRQPERPSVSTDNDALSSQSKSRRDPKIVRPFIVSEAMDQQRSTGVKQGSLGTSSDQGLRAVKNTTEDALPLLEVIERAWSAGAKAWVELEAAASQAGNQSVAPIVAKVVTDPCPASLAMTGRDLEGVGRVLHLPCGLMFGSAITLIGKPRDAHIEYKPPIARVGEGVSPYVMVSQFIIELQGLKVVDGEDPPRILHVNPRLRGDWSWKPVIEHNTCYRGQWGSAHRCEGWQVPEYDETVDGLPKCEKWLRDDDKQHQDAKKSWWLGRLVGRSDKETLEWEYPLSEGRQFVLTIRAGVEGFHVTVDGRHISSFPYRTGYVVEEATGISVAGDVDIFSMTVTSLPITHPSYYPELVLEEGDMWKAPLLPTSKIQLFVGVMSSSNHFAERMAVRKTWLQSKSIQSLRVVARFFVALHANKDINLQLKKEADYYGDMIILPFIDRYDIVVLKTVAICKFGVQNVTAEYIMKCDDDTFVRVDSVLEEVQATSIGEGLYLGSMNEFHRPLRTGKWAVTFEEWPERIYPIYANGPGYILSVDIVRFIVEQSEKGTLRLFKMEDVSVGLWVGQYAKEKHVQYEHSVRFAQAGCVEHYLTAHYQSPRQMMCLWDKFLATKDGKCCNM